jgi:hypothetical protein
VQQRWSLPSLTARDAAPPSFADVLSLATPSTDDVLAGVTVVLLLKYDELPLQQGQLPREGVSPYFNKRADRASLLK